MDVGLDFGHPYLTRQLIAYIGNKRRLLPLIHRALHETCGGKTAGLTLLDLFAGSGAVSRLARLMGFRVLSNDWEVFCRIINTAHVATQAGEADALFTRQGGLDAALEDLQAPGDPGEPWVSRFYAPATDDPEAADYRRERLFYTRANALAIDRIRERVETRYPEDGTETRERQRSLLIAPLLYEAATHTNTSGVFKAFHKGFGGHGRDALKRILGPIRLERPVLVDTAVPSVVYARDAAQLAREVAVDVAYLDPPYAPHQYGSNYHLLTSIALWDRPPAPLVLDAEGRLRDKAGIRPDWIRTRSAYCSRRTAAAALGELVAGVRARRILLSYSSDGLVPLEEVLDICEARGRVRVHTDEYTVYPGGRQSSRRRRRNVEAVILVDTTRRPSAATRRAAARDVECRAATVLLGRRYVRQRLESRLGAAEPDGLLRLELGSGPIDIRRLPDGSLVVPEGLEGLGLAQLRALRSVLEACVCRDAGEELEELTRILREDPQAPRSTGTQLLRGLRKLAHRSNRAVFTGWLRVAREIAGGGPPRWRSLNGELDSIERRAQKRFAG